MSNEYNYYFPNSGVYASIGSDDIDFITKLGGLSPVGRAQTDNIRGINANLNGTPAPGNQDSYGMTFFTRPDLNLSIDNIRTNRILSSLLTSDSMSMASAIRAMLDWRLSSAKEGGNPQAISDLFDSESKQAFIPLLTNNLISISGFPDIMVDTYSSKEGIYKETFSMVDGTAHIYNSYDLTANFRNLQGDPITLLMYVWVLYSSLVYDGSLIPHVDNIVYNRIDYTTKIFRLVLNKEFTHVQKIAACGAAFPSAVPLGAAFNYSDDAEFNKDSDQISIRFNCVGADYMDYILVKEFNNLVSYFNSDMSDTNRYKKMVCLHPNNYYTFDKQNYGKIGNLLINLLNYDLFPRINPGNEPEEAHAIKGRSSITGDLAFEWWVTEELYNLGMETLIRERIIGSDRNTNGYIRNKV